jgi:hypothetical protein
VVQLTTGDRLGWELVVTEVWQFVRDERLLNSDIRVLVSRIEQAKSKEAELFEQR